MDEEVMAGISFSVVPEFDLASLRPGETVVVYASSYYHQPVEITVTMTTIAREIYGPVHQSPHLYTRYLKFANMSVAGRRDISRYETPGYEFGDLAPESYIATGTPWHMQEAHLSEDVAVVFTNVERIMVFH